MHLLEFLYYLGFSVKQYYSVAHQKRLPCRVISIGNITVGGTGKTPATIAIAEEAQKRGMRPVILTRGYKGKAKGPCFVTRGKGPLLSVEDAGDEPVLMAERLDGVPIVKGANRFEAGMFAIRELPIGDPEFDTYVFILDDGFQHWRLKRDEDILLLDADRPFGNGRLLPLGPLREPVAAMKRADVIVITKTDSSGRDRRPAAESLIKKIRQHSPNTPVFLADRRPSNFVSVKGEIFPLAWAHGKRFFGFCGIGNHRSFMATLTATGAELAGFKRFRDHYGYRTGDLKSIMAMAKRDEADWIVTTEKDIMRLEGFDLPENLVALGIDFFADAGFYEEVFKGIRA